MLKTTMMIIARKFVLVGLLVLSLAFNNSDGGADAFCTFDFSSSSSHNCYRSDDIVIVNRNGNFPLFFSSSSTPSPPVLSSTRRKTTKATTTYLSTNTVINLREQRESSSTRIFLVSEEDVLEAVEYAETSWAAALEARKTANELSDKAEEEAEATAELAKKAENIFDDRSKRVTMEQLVQVDAVAKNSLESTSSLNRAMEASDEADRLEQEAEEALRKSEERLDQHLKDYPDSPLA
jgi:hypothetical protein